MHTKKFSKLCKLDLSTLLSLERTHAWKFFQITPRSPLWSIYLFFAKKTVSLYTKGFYLEEKLSFSSCSIMILSIQKHFCESYINTRYIKKECISCMKSILNNVGLGITRVSSEHGKDQYFCLCQSIVKLYFTYETETLKASNIKSLSIKFWNFREG